MKLEGRSFCTVKSLASLTTWSKAREGCIKGCRMGRSDKVSLWYMVLLFNTTFCVFILE